jgi:hypothetical protein
LGASIFQIDCPHLIDSIDEHQRMRRVYRNPKWAMKFVPLTFTELIMALLLVSGQAVAQEPIREKTESVPEQKASSPKQRCDSSGCGDRANNVGHDLGIQAPR